MATILMNFVGNLLFIPLMKMMMIADGIGRVIVIPISSRETGKLFLRNNSSKIELLFNWFSKLIGNDGILLRHLKMKNGA